MGINTVKWGILAAADIAAKFADSNRLVENSEIIAVGARSLEKARKFAADNNIARAYGSYEELLSDPEVNAVYVATVHTFHYKWVMAALNAGKHVLCEKTFALTPEQTHECMELARKKGLFLMEAMWMRFLPIFPKLHAWIDSGRIGKIKQIKADFLLDGENPRLFNHDVGGGGLLDTGVYPLNFACMFLGYDPIRVTGLANVVNGVDYSAAYVMQYEGGALASLTCSVDFEGDKQGRITGETGYITLDYFWRAESAKLYAKDGTLLEEAYAPHEPTGFSFEIADAVSCIRNGKTQSEIMPMEDSLKIAHIQKKLFDDFHMSF